MIDSNPKCAPNGPFVLASTILSRESRSPVPDSSCPSRPGEKKKDECRKGIEKDDWPCRSTRLDRCRSGAAIPGVSRYAPPLTTTQRGSLSNCLSSGCGSGCCWMSVQGWPPPAGPRTGQQRLMTASRRRDLAIVALPRRTFPACPLGALKRVWNGGEGEFSLVVVRGRLRACGFATEVEQEGRRAFLARSSRNGTIASRSLESECLTSRRSIR